MLYANILTNYQSVLIFFVASLVISIVFFALSYTLASQLPDAEKISTYECGFDPFEETRKQVDVHFYIVAILFLIFDLEVVYTFPWIVSLFTVGSQGFWAMVVFILLLGLGLVYEIIKGALDW